MGTYSQQENRAVVVTGKTNNLVQAGEFLDTFFFRIPEILSFDEERLMRYNRFPCVSRDLSCLLTQS